MVYRNPNRQRQLKKVFNGMKTNLFYVECFNSTRKISKFIHNKHNKTSQQEAQSVSNLVVKTYKIELCWTCAIFFSSFFINPSIVALQVCFNKCTLCTMYTVIVQFFTAHIQVVFIQETMTYCRVNFSWSVYKMPDQIWSNNVSTYSDVEPGNVIKWTIHTGSTPSTFCGKFNLFSKMFRDTSSLMSLAPKLNAIRG